MGFKSMGILTLALSKFQTKYISYVVAAAVATAVATTAAAGAVAAAAAAWRAPPAKLAPCDLYLKIFGRFWTLRTFSTFSNVFGRFLDRFRTFWNIGFGI